MADSIDNTFIIDDELVSTNGSDLSILDSALFSNEDEPSTPSSNQLSQASKKRKKDRPLKAIKTWSFARDPHPGEPKHQNGHRLWYCRFKQCSDFRALNTRNARLHLIKQHGIQVEEDESLVKKATQQRLEGLFERQGLSASAIRKKNQEKVLREVVNKAAVHEAFAQLITMRNLPHNAVKWPELRALLLTVNWTAEDVLIDSHSTVPKLINKSFVLDKEILKEKLHSSKSKIHFTVDCWSSPNRKSFQAICAHFVDEEGVLRKALLALPYHPQSHGGEQQAAEFMKVIDDYEIADRIGYFTCDNHGSNDKMLRFISQDLRIRGIRDFDAKQARIRCHGHIINLTVQAFMFTKDPEAVEAAARRAEEAVNNDEEVDIEDTLAARFKKAAAEEWRQMGAIGKIHNFVVWLRLSNARYNEFLALAGKMISLDNDTRWNSWFTMLEGALKLRSHVNKTLEKYYNEIKLDFLTPEDWKILQDTYDFLQPFYRVTKETQYDFSTLDQTLYTMDFLISHFKASEGRKAH